MNTASVGFIGGGRVTRIFLEGWKRTQALPEQITISDPNIDVLGYMKAHFPAIHTASDNMKAATQDIVFLAVHPPMLAATATAIKGALKRDALVVSLAPKFTIDKLGELLGGFKRIARIIPNAPSIIGQGFNPTAFGTALTADDKSAIKTLLTPLGDCPEVAETKLDAYAVLTAMGPTYLWFQLQALRDVATGFGLTEAEIAPALKRMVCGSTRTLLEAGLTPTEVMDLVPVKPLDEMEAQVSELYRTRLSGIYQKIKP
jgi:pyrroline-5-carboxylate reductase